MPRSTYPIKTEYEEQLGSIKKYLLWPLNIQLRFGIQGSGLKFEAAFYWTNWTKPVNNWVCGYYPIRHLVIYDCLPEVNSAGN